uniref:Secreted protein n=1 Tax=Echinococcus granulosus TaxID=6210 RepID=A0A068WY90_ECHGR|nr:hypothetical protein EgrG_002060900 [Echinococcus granulosus]
MLILIKGSFCFSRALTLPSSTVQLAIDYRIHRLLRNLRFCLMGRLDSQWLGLGRGCGNSVSSV